MPRFDYPESMSRLVLRLRALPGVGPRGAERMALWILQQGRAAAHDLARSLDDTLAAVRSCDTCGFFSENNACPACGARVPEPDVLCVVEQATDVMSIERSGSFAGRFHVLGGRLSPLDNIGPEKLRIAALLQNLDGVTEVILALGSDVEGEATANYLARLLEGRVLKITRPAQGLPAGGALEQADALTLSRALAARAHFTP